MRLRKKLIVARGLTWQTLHDHPAANFAICWSSRHRLAKRSTVKSFFSEISLRPPLGVPVIAK